MVSYFLPSIHLFICILLSIGVQVQSLRITPLTVQKGLKCHLSMTITDENTKKLFPNESRKYRIREKPANGAVLGLSNFMKEFGQLIGSIEMFQGNTDANLPESLNLHLSNAEVHEAELLREKQHGRIEVSPIARFLYDAGLGFVDKFFEDRPIATFWFLETVARIPYFSFMSMLHLYESLGWWRQSSLRRLHNAEEWNELHHLLIMEALGGDKVWSDRFLAYHCAIAYYWLIIGTYALSPRIAYQFMELLETHANDTYAEFVRQNEEKLRCIPAPEIAVSYYTGDDMYPFDDFQIDRPPGSRRPPCENLYDVFVNIRDDEAEHVSTMRACQKFTVDGSPVISPHIRFRNERVSVAREEWKRWSEEVNMYDKEKEKEKSL